MTFWTNSGFEPKQDFKWQVTVETQRSERVGSVVLTTTSILPSFYAKSVKKPSFSVNMKTYKLVNREIRHPQNLIWEPIDVVFVDTIDSPILKFIKEYLETTEYTNISEASLQNNTTSKKGSNSFLSNVTIEQYDSIGTVVEKWTLYKPQISKFSASELNYDNDSLSTYTLTIDYDWANVSESA